MFHKLNKKRCLHTSMVWLFFKLEDNFSPIHSPFLMQPPSKEMKMRNHNALTMIPGAVDRAAMYKYVAIVLGVMAIIAAPSALAQATVWTGGASTSDWNTADNWDNGVPVGVGGASATIALDGANVTMSAAGVSRDLTVSGNGTTAPVLNITQNLTNNFSRIHVGSDASGTDFRGTVNHTAGTLLIGGGSGSRDLHIATRAGSTGSNSTGTYNFGGVSATAPKMDIQGNISMGNRSGETAFLNLSGHGEVDVGGNLNMSLANGDSTFRVEGGNLDINIAGNLAVRNAGAGWARVQAVIDDTGFSTINVGGDVTFFTTTNPTRGRFELELGAGYTHTLNTVYTIIDANSFAAEFGNVANNDILTVGGNEFRANYVTGGTGEQFTITAIPEPSSVVLVLGALATAVAMRRRIR